MQQTQRWGRWNPNDLNQGPQWPVLTRLVGYGWRHRKYMAGAFLTMVGATLSAMVIPRILGSAIDEAFESGLRSQFVVLALAILAFSALRAGFSYGQTYLSEAVSQKAAYDLRNDFFRKLQNLSFGFHDRQQTGNLMSKATADVEACRRFISMGLIRGTSTLLTLGVVTAIMLAANWRLGLVCLVFVPMLVVDGQRKCPAKWPAKMSLVLLAMITDGSYSTRSRFMGGLRASMYFFAVSRWMPSSRATPRVDNPLRFAF